MAEITVREVQPDPGVLSPREIVRRIHQEIAAKSPAHAALVASFEAGWERPLLGGADVHLQKRARLWRLREYAALRARNVSREEAARLLGIAEKTAENYDSDIRHGRLPAQEAAA